MNQADYKAIAEIINRHWKHIPHNFAIELADYFDEEFKESLTRDTKNIDEIKQKFKEEFNRQQFLEQCGV